MGGGRKVFIPNVNTWVVRVVFRISRCTPFLLRQVSGFSSLVLLGSSVVNFPKSDFAADGGGVENFFIPNVNTWVLRVIFRISRCTPFLLRQASGSTSLVLLGSSVVNFPKSDFAADGGGSKFFLSLMLIHGWCW